MIMVVNPNHKNPSPQAAVEPPLWAGLIASDNNAEILDAEALDLDLNETEEFIRSRKPDKVIIVVMGNNPSVSSTPKMQVAEALADRIKELNVFLTGIHPIAVGSKYPVIRKAFKGFPMMPWDKLPMDRYRAHNWHCLDGTPRSPYASVYTSLGCPFDCYFCNIHALYGNRKVLFRPILDVLQEVEILVHKYGVRNIKIWDELFTLDLTSVIAICGYLSMFDLNIWAYARVDTVTKEMIRVMKKGGVKWLAFGFETENEWVRNRVMRKGTTNSQIEKAIEMTKDAGINIIANFMFGLPETTEEDDQRSLEFAISHLFEYVNFYVARPYPGSKWYEDTKPDMEWTDYNQYGTRRSSFRDNAFRTYFTNPDYLTMIKRKFGLQAVHHIDTMLNAGRVNEL